MHTRGLYLLVLIAGCGTQAPTVTLHHGYPVGQRILSPSTDDVVLAVGATAELDFFDPPATLQGGSGWVASDDVTGIEILSAEADKPEIVQVVRAQGRGITVEGRQMGWSKVRLSTARGEADLIVHVAEPASVVIAHDAVDLDPAAPRVFLQGGTARFTMVQHDSAGRLLTGWGHMAPIRIDPPGAARTELREGDIEHVDVTLDQPGEVTLRPLGGDPVTVTVVPEVPDAEFGLNALTAPPATEPLVGLTTGTPQLAVLWVARPDGARVFGIIERARLVSVTPDTCDVERMERWYSEGVYNITPRAPGECALEATYGARTTTISVPVE